MTQQIYNNQFPEIGIYGQVIEHHELLDDSIRNFDPKCGTENNCYVLDEGASIIGFLGQDRDLDEVGLGDHLTIHNPCLVKSLVDAGIYENYVYDDAFCFCPEVLPEKPKFNSAPSGHFTSTLFASSVSLCIKVFSLLFNLVNFAFWSSCQNILFEIYSSFSLAAESSTKDVLFNYRIENQLSLCNVAFDKYIYTDKVPYLQEKTTFVSSNWKDSQDPGCAACAVNSSFQVQRLLKTNLIMISLSATEDFCGSKRFKLFISYWKMPKNICQNNKEDEYSAPVNCPMAIHHLETSDPGNVYCGSRKWTSTNVFYLCASSLLAFRTVSFSLA